MAPLFDQKTFGKGWTWVGEKKELGAAQGRWGPGNAANCDFRRRPLNAVLQLQAAPLSESLLLMNPDDPVLGKRALSGELKFVPPSHVPSVHPFTSPARASRAPNTTDTDAAIAAVSGVHAALDVHVKLLLELIREKPRAAISFLRKRLADSLLSPACLQGLSPLDLQALHGMMVDDNIVPEDVSALTNALLEELGRAGVLARQVAASSVLPACPAAKSFPDPSAEQRHIVECVLAGHSVIVNSGARQWAIPACLPACLPRPLVEVLQFVVLSPFFL